MVRLLLLYSNYKTVMPLCDYTIILLYGYVCSVNILLYKYRFILFYLMLGRGRRSWGQVACIVLAQARCYREAMTIGPRPDRPAMEPAPAGAEGSAGALVGGRRFLPPETAVPAPAEAIRSNIFILSLFMKGTNN